MERFSPDFCATFLIADLLLYLQVFDYDNDVLNWISLQQFTYR